MSEIVSKSSSIHFYVGDTGASLRRYERCSGSSGIISIRLRNKAAGQSKPNKNTFVPQRNNRDRQPDTRSQSSSPFKNRRYRYDFIWLAAVPSLVQVMWRCGVTQMITSWISSLSTDDATSESMGEFLPDMVEGR